MTGFNSKHLNHKCDRNGCYIDKLPLWDEWIECFPRGIRPADIDGMVEINGRFLFMEEKGLGATLTSGQGYALRRLARQPNTTVVVFRPGKFSELEVLIFDADGSTGYKPFTREQFKDWLRTWAMASEQPGVA